jgi:hypothetical protein
MATRTLAPRCLNAARIWPFVPFTYIGIHLDLTSAARYSKKSEGNALLHLSMQATFITPLMNDV